MDNQKKKEFQKEWVKVPNGACYADLSSRTMRNLIKTGEIRHSRLSSGTILIKKSWIDDFLEKKEVKLSQLDEIVGGVLNSLKK